MGRLVQTVLSSLAVCSVLGCTTTRAAPPVELVPGYNAVFLAPYLSEGTKGVQVTGFVCGRTWRLPPVRTVRVERVDPGGRVIEAVEARVRRHPARCQRYRLTAPWPSTAPGRLRICSAEGEGASCHARSL